ncbi:DsbE family thiol:disulfide interchange protein [Halorhodospira halophila]|uniref:Periplasmic protein thiol--disulfide oxidoreductase DsbE n=1 Tax=Halorhodospira halophila (strain DSM 244 / SL1) TaxID=349124 RepID=A1WWS5_HALHL|nr:DsbE family thiol:disulfide interchange protein [Halorhodospira halophila]ABM62137.1 periplasmic protein thiol--disulfide oxidoreductase DsbE [Halorhodospira halophila SL1]MBK1729465.1 DsbE family thiol:disulfide interchange protein [Halorhodospira halophila]
MNKRLLLPLLLTLPVLGLLYVGLTLDSRSLPSPLVGKPAPDFELESLRDAGVTLTRDDFIGEIALVNVWASWCDSCRHEHTYWRQLADRGIPIHAFNYRDSRENAHRYLEFFGDPFREIAYDPRAEAGMEWGVYATPETYVLDAEGIIRHKHIGPVNAEVLRNDILPLIEELEAERS